MANSYPKSHLTRYGEVLGAVAPQRDTTWGKILFRAPELSNARLIFDPQPFRTQEFIPAKAAKNRSSR